MKVYELNINSKEFSVFYETNHKSFVQEYWKSNWEEIKNDQYVPRNLKIYRADNGKKNYQTDIGVILGKLIILSEKAVKILKPILVLKGQFLPVNTENKKKKYIGFYPSKDVKPLNYVNLEVSDWDQCQYGKLFRKVKLNNVDLSNEYLFVINEVNLGVFVTDKFRELVEKNDLKGFDFSREVEIID